ncbi:MAG: cation:proton antiporter [Candidatus Eisenbacteria bacterium]|uniref:Cation:proton antiporter n=1 Tax=Eiseniibacteriota bacterium TaxID=2212470 RepID=A0A849SR94_UNCEI|nr:cation:proton antiporter [Candidatus Eisenbacteria bacterium]
MSVGRLPLPALFAAAFVTLAPGVARAAGEHGVDLQPILFGLTLVILGARLGGELFERLRLPAVLGELIAGITIGNLPLVGITAFAGLAQIPSLEVLAQLGVLFLLFGVGLESDLGQMRKVGRSATLVALLGVVAPMILGYFVTRLFFPDHNRLADWFVGATLCATSVGITARVLADLGKTRTPEGRIILGAAVIDDILGLIVLAVVAGIIQAADRGAAFDPMSVLSILLKSLAFLAGAIVIGRWLSKHAFGIASRMKSRGLLLPLALLFCFGFAWLAGVAGLAPIVGAFAAGLILEEVHYRELRDQDSARHDLHELLKPLSAFLVPIFFVTMGMQVDLRAFARLDVLGFAAVLTLVAILGKQVCSLGVLEKGVDRLTVGLGMIPRGEVGLIFASIGASLTIAGERVITSDVYSAVVVMVSLTTLLTPPLLAWRFRR